MARATYEEIAKVLDADFPQYSTMMPSRIFDADGMTVFAPETSLGAGRAKLFINKDNVRLELDFLTFRYFYDEEMDDADAIAVGIVRALDQSDNEMQEEMSEHPW